MKTIDKQDDFSCIVNHFTSKQYELALAHANTFLERSPKHKDCLKLIAYIHLQNKHFSLALDYLTVILDTNQADAEIFNLIGAVFLEAEDFTQSIFYLEKAISQDEKFLDAHTNLALALQKNKQYDLSVIACIKAEKLFPENTLIVKHHANALFTQNDFTAAREAYKRLLTLEPQSNQAHRGIAKCNLALNKVKNVVEQLMALKKSTINYSSVRLDITNDLLQQGETEAAIAAYMDLIDDFSPIEVLYNNIASAYDQQDEPLKAIDYFKKALNENSQYVSAMSNIGRIYTDMQDFKAAEIQLKNARQIQPNNVNALINLGRLYEHTNKYESAKDCLLSALKIEPNNPIVHYNLANTYHYLGENNLAQQHYIACLSIDPNYNDAEQNLGISELAEGNFKNAWGHYFKRRRILDKKDALSTITPGMPLSGKHIYFCRSQGIGDELFFLRFLSILKKQQNITVTYRTSNKTYALFSQIKDIDCLLDENEPTPECDYYFTVDDLPLILKIDDVKKIPPPLSLTAKPSLVEKIKKILDAFPPPYTGLTWQAGNQATPKYNKNNHRILSKNFPTEFLPKIIDSLKGSIVILQRNPDSKQIEKIAKNTNKAIIDLSHYNESLDEMLALLSLIDNYIGVSNTNTHLYAALNKTANVLIPFPPDWRWMNKGERSPWFPKMPLFRQSVNGDWEQSVNSLLQDIRP